MKTIIITILLYSQLFAINNVIFKLNYINNKYIHYSIQLPNIILSDTINYNLKNINIPTINTNDTIISNTFIIKNTTHTKIHNTTVTFITSDTLYDTITSNSIIIKPLNIIKKYQNYYNPKNNLYNN